MPDDEPIYRTASEADLLALRDAHLASIREIAAHYYAAETIAWWSKDRGIEGYQSAMRDGGETYFIAEALGRGTVLGFSSHRIDDGCHRLQGFYVRGTAARRGIGTRLLTMVEDFARAQGARELVVEGALSAEAFYRARGFREISRGQHESGPVSIDVVNMAKTLV